MVAVGAPSGTTEAPVARYRYDGFGQRAVKQIHAIAGSRFVYGQDAQVARSLTPKTWIKRPVFSKTRSTICLSASEFVQI